MAYPYGLLAELLENRVRIQSTSGTTPPRYRTRDIRVLSREKFFCGRTRAKMSRPMGPSEGKAVRVTGKHKI